MSRATRRERWIRKVRRRWGIGLLLPARFLPDRSGAPAVAPPWTEPDRKIPDDLLTYPGEKRDLDEEQRFAESEPLNEFFSVHPEASEFIVDHGRNFIKPAVVKLARAVHRLRRATRMKPAAARPATSPADLTSALRIEAERIGLSRIGIANNDPKYTFPVTDAEQLPTVIVCLVEQDWELTQKIPSDEAESAAMFGYAEGMARTAQLAGFLKRLGYRAAPQGLTGDGLTIHYGVASGLGQLGLNGQLLTPEAGSRCRILLMTTDAELTLDEPIDFGLHKVCDECQACVRNCPVGAIPKTRKSYRGVVKAKLNTARCLPVVAQAAGCAICMKVCPVQRYGLDAILDHREKTGEILGVGTDELEGYDWPLDDRHYGPGETPQVGEEIMQNPDLVFDYGRKTPPPGVEPIRFTGPKHG
ncbi:MAG: 4Fe-4S dicluster domain-containing protein [Solirubrobacterales bacterium]|nr:4Fe-4S dicluster domain-containing protein [Solirubrobacterales bacterium]